MIVGLTSGCFDLIHVGHLRYLEKCRAKCDTLIVGVDSDSIVTKAKGKTRPIISETERLEMIQSLSCVDSGFIVEHMNDFQKVVTQFGVKKLFKSERFKDMKKVFGFHDVPEPFTPELEIINDVPGLRSTTWIVEKIRGNME